MRDIPGACPLDCPDGCSWVVTIDDDGKAVRVRGNPDHPFTRGGLCKKVNPWLEPRPTSHTLDELLRESMLLFRKVPPQPELDEASSFVFTLLTSLVARARSWALHYDHHRGEEALGLLESLA